VHGPWSRGADRDAAILASSPWMSPRPNPRHGIQYLNTAPTPVAGRSGHSVSGMHCLPLFGHCRYVRLTLPSYPCIVPGRLFAGQ
jgi:hypothetical protein